MRILHTSDWHLGQNFYTKDRKKEHEKFLNWLLHCLTANQVDALIVAGDIFDTAAPPNYALEQYYRFIKGLAKTPCRQTVIVGGNHDSASNLQAPKDLLKLFNVHIVGSISKQSSVEDILVLDNDKGEPVGVVCAVPFLRERDIRSAVPGETYADKSLAYQNGIASYYCNMLTEALKICAGLGGAVRLPIIATGHLFTAGSELSDGVRDIAVGSLDGISTSVFPAGYDYVALGHLHKPQRVGGHDTIRYSGSPLPLSFGEARLAKQVVIVDFVAGKPAEIRTVEVPGFQAIESVKGDWPVIENYFDSIRNREDEIWLEVVLETDDWGEQAKVRIDALAKGTSAQVLVVKRAGRNVLALRETASRPTLAEFLPAEVFGELLKLAEIDDEVKRTELTLCHDELLERAWQRWRLTKDED
nr:exonuclease SbcCD subunit D C-terminal domain-containing protein [Desulfobulbaceae bacterium]